VLLVVSSNGSTFEVVCDITANFNINGCATEFTTASMYDKDCLRKQQLESDLKIAFQKSIHLNSGALNASQNNYNPFSDPELSGSELRNGYGYEQFGYNGTR
jgi:hypothetical protein